MINAGRWEVKILERRLDRGNQGPLAVGAVRAHGRRHRHRLRDLHDLARRPAPPALRDPVGRRQRLRRRCTSGVAASLLSGCRVQSVAPAGARGSFAVQAGAACRRAGTRPHHARSRPLRSMPDAALCRLGDGPGGAAAWSAPIRAGAPTGAAADAAIHPAQQQPGRTFCDQNVAYRLADPSSVPDQYRRFRRGVERCGVGCADLRRVDRAGRQARRHGIDHLCLWPRGIEFDRCPAGCCTAPGSSAAANCAFKTPTAANTHFAPVIVDMIGHWINPKGESFQATFKQTP